MLKSRQYGRPGLCALFLAALLIPFSSSARAYDGTISVGVPAGPGPLTIQVAIPGIIPFGTVSGNMTVVPVNGQNAITANDTAASKAIKIAKAINTVYGGPPNVATVTGATIHLAAPAGTPRGGDAGYAVISIDKTNEGIVTAQIDTPSSDFPGLAAIIAYSDPLTGVDALGGVSTFTAALGYDGLNDTASIAYNLLADKTPNGLTTEIYNQLMAGLAPPLKPGLSLDLANDLITFNFPTGQTNYFMQNATSDTGLNVLGGLAPVPEPSTLLLLALGTAATLQRRKLR